MAEDRSIEISPESSEMPSSDLIWSISEALHRQDPAAAATFVKDLKAPDLADVIELLEADDRIPLIQAIGPTFDFEVLSELDENVRDQVSEGLPNDLLAKAVTQLDTDDAAYVIENLEESDKQEILAQLPSGERQALERNLEYPEETAGRIMQADFVAVPPFWTVGTVVDHMRESDNLPDYFSEIFVVDPTFHVLGAVDLSRLLRTKRDVPVSTIMDPDRHVVLATEGQEEVARQFQRYDLMSAPVVDESNRLVGVVTVDDVVEVIQDEADFEIKALAGVGDESLSDTVTEVAKPRFLWLFVNLFTALLASAVIGIFGATIEKMVALAVLMPIVASMGGNAGTQTMTVAVRALATRELTAANVARVVFRETAVGLLNGAAFAILMGMIAYFWFQSTRLGLVIGAAMIVNLLAAALAGIFIPLALNRMKFDPAVSSTVFVTTVTDVVGFFSFLGLATLWLK
ncbi:magnesium transporter [Hyphomicrobium sp.]|uniref:magnesium transporter n=1 Tax=Hyphomicrobium sp. TaxID=82 RepID=UPI002B77E6BD|nr:magnesium transporter [Hyphomicrobium sp.]HVZ04510.1 magnesium transporter [Hyphomicrobium sp.]